MIVEKPDFCASYSLLFHTFWHIVPEKTRKKSFHNWREKKSSLVVASTRFVCFICLSSSIINETNDVKSGDEAEICLTFLHFIISFNSKRYLRSIWRKKVGWCCILWKRNERKWEFFKTMFSLNSKIKFIQDFFHHCDIICDKHLQASPLLSIRHVQFLYNSSMTIWHSFHSKIWRNLESLPTFIPPSICSPFLFLPSYFYVIKRVLIRSSIKAFCLSIPRSKE